MPINSVLGTGAIALSIASLAYSTPASAVTECPVQISSMYTGDGLLFLIFNNGGSAYIYNTNASYVTIASLAISAFLVPRSITIRYAADGVSCTSTNRTDVSGIWLKSGA
jgi:hypothetical protein